MLKSRILIDDDVDDDDDDDDVGESGFIVFLILFLIRFPGMCQSLGYPRLELQDAGLSVGLPGRKYFIELIQIKFLLFIFSIFIGFNFLKTFLKQQFI